MSKLINERAEIVIKSKLLKDENEFDLSDQNYEFSHVFESYDFNNLTIKNRLYFKNLTDDMFFDDFGNPTKDFVNFYTKIADFGAGIVVLGPICISNKQGTEKHKKHNLKHKNKVINSYQKIIENIHCFGGKVFVNFKPSYGRGCGEFGWFLFNYSVSNHYSFFNGLKTIRISDGICKKLVCNFVEQAKHVHRLKFDGLVIDGSLFNILGEFASCEFNKRVFGYYSNVDELAVSVIKLICDAVPTINIIYTFSLSSLIEVIYKNEFKKIKTLKNVSFNETKVKVVSLLKKLVDAGVDGFEFEFGTFETEFFKNFNAFQGESFFFDIVGEIKNIFRKLNLKNKFGEDILVICNDNVNSLKIVDRAIGEKKFDMFNATKFFYSDNKFLKKIKQNNQYQKCIKCSYCNFVADKFGRVECAINPCLGDDVNMKGVSDLNNKVAVVGSGVSGIVATIMLAKREYKVELFDKNAIINQNGRLSEMFGFDELLSNFHNYLEYELQKFIDKNQVKLCLNHEVSSKELLDGEFYSIVVATGYHEKFLKINGAILQSVKNIFDVLKNKDMLLNKNKIILFIRSEFGLKFAIYLLKNNKNVSILLNSAEILLKLPNDKLYYYYTIFEKYNVKIYWSFKLKIIHEDFVELFVNNKLKDPTDLTFLINNKKKYKKITFEGKAKNIDMDLFVYEPELVSNNKLYYELVNDNFKGELFLIGDALVVSNLADEIKSGYFVGKNL